jgi:GDP-4-dehydro-6-deoxy-D-mannose reductase
MRAMAGETRLFIPSSAQVYAPADAPLRESDPLRPSSPYGLSKLAQELVASNGDGRPPYVVARAFNHFGPRQTPSFAASDFARRIAEIEGGRGPAEILVGNLDTSRDLTDVRDTVRAYHLIAERAVNGAIYNVCSGSTVKIGHLLDLLLARARQSIRIKVDPTRYRPNDQAFLLGSYDRIRDEIGWSPTIPLEQTIDDLLTFWRSQTSAV